MNRRINESVEQIPGVSVHLSFLILLGMLPQTCISEYTLHVQQCVQNAPHSSPKAELNYRTNNKPTHTHSSMKLLLMSCASQFVFSSFTCCLLLLFGNDAASIMINKTRQMRQPMIKQKHSFQRTNPSRHRKEGNFSTSTCFVFAFAVQEQIHILCVTTTRISYTSPPFFLLFLFLAFVCLFLCHPDSNIKAYSIRTTKERILLFGKYYSYYMISSRSIRTREKWIAGQMEKRLI